MNKMLNEMTRDELRSLAKELKLKGYSSMNRDQLEGYIRATYMEAKRIKAQTPMTMEARLNAYTADGQRPLTARQQARINRLTRRMEHSKGIR
jgi:hypothetical protein